MEQNTIQKEIDAIQEKLVTMADELTVERAELRGRLWKLLEEQNELLITQILNDRI